MKTKKAPAKPVNAMPIMPRRGSPEYREAARAEFNKRFEAQKKRQG